MPLSDKIEASEASATTDELNFKLTTIGRVNIQVLW